MEKKCHMYQEELLRELLLSFEEESIEQVDFLKARQKMMYQKLHDASAHLKRIEQGLKKEAAEEKRITLEAEKALLQEEQSHYQSIIEQEKMILQNMMQEGNDIYFTRIFSLLSALQESKRMVLFSSEDLLQEQNTVLLDQIVKKGREVLKKMKAYYLDKSSQDQENIKNQVKQFSKFLEELSLQAKNIRNWKQREAYRNSSVLEAKENDLSLRAQGYLEDMLQGKKIAIKSADLLLSILAYMIEHYDFNTYQDKILLFDETLFENETRIMIYHYLENLLAKKDRLTRARHEKKSRELLNLFETIENKIDASTETVLEKEHTQSYFDILVYLMNDEKNALYLQKLIARNGNFTNATNHQGLTILEYVVNAFQTNTLIKLKNQTKDYVEPAFLKDIFQAIIKSPYFDGFETFLETIQKNLLEFEKTILNSKYKPERKEEIIALIQEMLHERKKEEQPEFSCREIMLHYTMHSETEDDTRTKDQNNFTITLSAQGTPYHNCAYSITEEKGEYQKYWLNVYVTDVSCFVEQEILDAEQLKKKMFSDLKGNQDYLFPLRLVKYFSLEKGSTRPVIAYRFLINHKGRVEGLKIDRAVIQVDENYTFEDFNRREFRMQEDIKPFVITSGWLNQGMRENRGLEMVHAFENIVEQTIGHYFTSNHFAYIYKVCESDKVEDGFQLISDLNHLFYDLKEEDRKAIIGVLCEEKSRALYATRNFGHAALDQKYHSDLLHPLDSYIGMVLQSLTKKAIYPSKEMFLEPENLQALIEEANILKLVRNK